jgi:uncharacterized protein (DUF488 family)
VNPVRTIGHGTLPAADLAGLLIAADVALVADVRSYPGSRHKPQFAREALKHWLPEHGLAYAWMRELGGRRRPTPESVNVALRNDGFRAYADHMQTPAFARAVDALLTRAAEREVAVMCSESVWWRCHRRLLADYLVLVRGVDVQHVMHDGRVVAHPPTEGVRRNGQILVYDGGTTPTLALGGQ